MKSDAVQTKAVLWGGAGPSMNDAADPSVLPRGVYASLRNCDPYFVGELRKRLGRKRIGTVSVQPTAGGSVDAIGTITSAIPYDIQYGGVRHTGVVLTDGRYFLMVYHNGTAITVSPVEYDAGSGNLGTKWRGQNFDECCYMTNGESAVLALRVQGTAAVPTWSVLESGVRKPTTTQVATFTVAEADSAVARYTVGQVVYLRIAFYDSDKGVEGQPSDVTAAGDNIGTWKVTITGANDNILVTVPGLTTLAAQAGVDTIVVYASIASTTAGSKVGMYYDGEIAIQAGVTTCTYSMSALTVSGVTRLGVISDAGLAESDSMWDVEVVDGDPRVEKDMPPICKCIQSAGFRMWYGGAGTTVSPHTALPKNFIAFSESGEPEHVAFTFQQTDHYNGTYLPTRGDVVALGRAGDKLAILSRDDVFASWGLEPKFTLAEVDTGHGCVGNDATAQGEDATFYLSRNGAYVFSGQGVQPLTHNVLDRAYATQAALDITGAYGVYYAAKRQVWFFFPNATDGTAFVYQIGQGWVVNDGMFATCACAARGVHVNPATDSSEYLYLVHSFTDGDGSVCNLMYVLDSGDSDGALDAAGTAGLTAGTRSGTVTSATSTVLTDSTAALYTSGAKLKGCPVWVTDANGGGAELRYVTTNTGTTLTLNSALTATPTAGYKYYVGGIGMRIVTGSVVAVMDGYYPISFRGVQIQIDRQGYVDDAKVYCYPLMNRATAITSGETKPTINIGSSTELDSPVCGFNAALTTRGKEGQICIENFQGDRPIKILRIAAPYDVLPSRG